MGRVKNCIVCTYPVLWQDYESTPCTCCSPVFPHFHSSTLKKLQNHMECEVAGPRQETELLFQGWINWYCVSCNRCFSNLCLKSFGEKTVKLLYLDLTILTIRKSPLMCKLNLHCCSLSSLYR